MELWGPKGFDTAEIIYQFTYRAPKVRAVPAHNYLKRCVRQHANAKGKCVKSFKTLMCFFKKYEKHIKIAFHAPYKKVYEPYVENPPKFQEDKRLNSIDYD